MEAMAALAGIVMINLLLSGDNALIIALASRNLPKRQRRLAVIFGSVGAVVLRMGLMCIVLWLLAIPWLQLFSGVLLLWISIRLLADRHAADRRLTAHNSLWAAVKTIIIADVVMSLDNVLAIAGAAKGSLLLLTAGLALSIPLIMWGSRLLGVLVERWPVSITLGAAFLGWTAGSMAIAERQLAAWLIQYPWLSWLVPAAFTIAVVKIGKILSSRGS